MMAFRRSPVDAGVPFLSFDQSWLLLVRAQASPHRDLRCRSLLLGASDNGVTGPAQETAHGASITANPDGARVPPPGVGRATLGGGDWCCSADELRLRSCKATLALGRLRPQVTLTFPFYAFTSRDLRRFASQSNRMMMGYRGGEITACDFCYV